MSVSVYLNFDGNCKEAVEYYRSVFRADPQQIMTFGEGPSDPAYPIPEEAKDRIVHTFLDIKGMRLMFSDIWPGMEFIVGNNMSMIVVDKDMDEIKRLYEELKEGGKVEMELQETFWSKAYASIVDRFGVCWQLSHGE
ncbi:VOC family protein [Gudongella oleilytica]|jgi:PhnB protein|uniref:VOC family protein n=1 Tax=Gudongella oleilytica TaxID=1582259 RepID=UPI000FF8A9F0|nr:VOC family protein [Gudongella oleilytica]HMM69497.1 VOC family protein [Gudongella oleilytica]